MNTPKRKRVTIKPKNPNPLFEKWLTEWRDRAQESESKMQYTFNIALNSLKKYPLPLETGKDCKILYGFGEKLCKMLDDKLVQHKAENSDVLQLVTGGSFKKNPTQRKSKSPQKTKEYIPQHGSGAFAILVTLYEKSLEANYPGHMSKEDIIKFGQHLSNTLFTKPGPDTRYTAWSSMKTLIEKKLVLREGKPYKFSLSNEGIALADKLYIQQKIEEFKEQENEEPKPSCSQILFNKEQPLCKPSNKGPILKQKSINSKVAVTSTLTSFKTLSSTSSQNSTYESVILAPNSFQIILLVDTQEVSGGKTNLENEPIYIELNKLKVCHEIRNLKVGDYVWICRDDFNNELVLPYIIERKRMDDLGSSIKDDRFHEQKFRLKQCGLSNLIYLIENYGSNEHVGLPLTTLLQAATNTLIQDGFTVKFTENLKGTCKYLACLTNLIINLFKGKTLVSCSKEDLQELVIDDDLLMLMHFKEFNKASSKIKHFKVKDMFIRQLLQIHTLSVDKAFAIVEKYPTPKLLKLAYDEVSPEEGEKLLATLRYGKLNKNIGPVLSRIIYQLFCKNSY